MNKSRNTDSSNIAGAKPVRRRTFMGGLLAGGLLGSLLAGGALAQTENGYRFWHAGHGCGGRHAMHDPIVMRERADFMADFMLDRIKATDQQRPQVKAVIQATLDDLLKVRELHDKHRTAMVNALSQPSIDRAQLQQIRAAEVKLLDDASQRVVNALADVADILTPAQRAELAKLASRWRGHGDSL